MKSPTRFTDAFLAAFQLTSEYEGLLSQHPMDRGGLTYKGIAKAYHPNWHGWGYVMEAIKKHDGNRQAAGLDLEKDEVLRDAVRDFYYSNYWLSSSAHDVAPISRAIAIYLYDMAVNHGNKKAKTLLQRSLNRIQPVIQKYDALDVDGIVGLETLRAILLSGRHGYEQMAMGSLFITRWKLYESIVQRDPSQAVFLSGWLKRAAGVIQI